MHETLSHCTCSVPLQLFYAKKLMETLNCKNKYENVNKIVEDMKIACLSVSQN